MEEEEEYRKLTFPDIMIDEDTAHLYCMKEKFRLMSKENEEIGYVKININVAQSCDYFEFTVHASSKFETSDMGVNGMSLTSRVRPSLTTMEEKRREYTNFQDIKKEYNLYLAKLKKTYFISSTFYEGAVVYESSANKRTYSTAVNQLYNFVTEAANLIIIKNIAINKLWGKLKTKSLLMNGDICYSALIAEQENLTLGETTIFTTKVTRLIKIEVNPFIQKLETWLDDKGQIILQKWNDSDITMVIEPDVDTIKGAGELLQSSWRNDMQLTSIYLDRLGMLLNHYTTYFYDCPQAEQLLSDFIIILLMRKPEDVVTFAIDYFLTISN